MKNMNILLLDTTKILFVAVVSQNGDIIDEIEEQNVKISEKILGIIEILMQRNKIESFDMIAVNVGPGSFVGTRAGIATIMGMRAALSMPVITFSSMEIIAFALQKSHCHAVLYSHQNMFYVQEWDEGKSRELQMIPHDVLLKKLDQKKMVGDYGKLPFKHENFLYQPITKQQTLNLLQNKLKKQIFAGEIIQQHVKYK